MALVEALLADEPDDPDLWLYRAQVARAGVAVDQANFDDALTVLRDAVMLNPTSSALRRNVDILEDIVLLRTER